jgi:hypothetical protein
MLTLSHPVSGQAEVKGVLQATNAVLHPWIKEQVKVTLKTLPEKLWFDEDIHRTAWQAWQLGLSQRITRAKSPPPLRVLLIWVDLQGYRTPGLVLWLFAYGVMPLFTPSGALLFTNISLCSVRLYGTQPFMMCPICEGKF